MNDGSFRTQAERGGGLRSRSVIAVLLALVTFTVFVLVRAPTIVLLTVNIFDEGLQLASGAFAAKGLIAFRDYYVPYGPANAYMLAALRIVGLDSMVSSRVLLLLLNGAVAGLGTYLIIRKRGILAAVVFGSLAVVFPPALAYVGVVLLIMAAFLTAIGWRLGPLKRPLTEEPSTGNNVRLLVVGVFLALAVWFRWEFGVVLAVWCVLVLRRPGSTTAVKVRLTIVPFLLASAPYVAIVALGGAGNLFDAIKYAVFSYPRYRSLPFPIAAPWELIRAIWSDQTIPGGQLVVTVSFFAVAIGLLLIAVGPIADRYQRIQWARVFERDDTRMIVIVGATAGFLLFSLRTRPDVSHASQLVLLGWLAILWGRPRYNRLAITVGVVVSLTSLVVLQPLQSNGWATASARIQASTSDELPRSQYVRYRYDDDVYLKQIVDAWLQYRLENPGTTDAVFVANRSNSLTHVNAPIVYWLLDASPAHWLTTFDPGFADQAEQQREMVVKLCESGAMLVLREPILGAEHPPDRRFSEILDDFIEENYVIVHSNDRYDLLRLSDNGCGGIPAA